MCEKSLRNLPSITLVEHPKALAPELLRDRARTLRSSPRLEIQEDSASHANPIHSMVFKESRILRRDERPNELFGHLINGHRQAILHAEVLTHAFAVTIIENARRLQAPHFGKVQLLRFLIIGPQKEGEQDAPNHDSEEGEFRQATEPKPPPRNLPLFTGGF